MAQRSSSMESKARLRRILRQELLTGTDAEIATTHEINRESSVKEILTHIFFMAKYGMIPSTLTIDAAEAQYIVAPNGNQAAHCAPGQIMHGTDLLQGRITISDSLHLEIENLFGKTDVMHPRFNKADRDAEANGLLAA